MPSRGRPLASLPLLLGLTLLAAPFPLGAARAVEPLQASVAAPPAALTGGDGRPADKAPPAGDEAGDKAPPAGDKTPPRGKPAEKEPPREDKPAGVSLTVRVSELKNDRGRVAVALFASADDFPDQKKALAGKLTRIQAGRAAVTFSDVRPGVYAVAVLHDENENDRMDFNFLGMPLEGYGFSNDAAATFGPPSFEAAAFKLSPRASYIPVKARYFP